jgi:hypothetical protein
LYRLTSVSLFQIIYWDSKALYMEHRFILQLYRLTSVSLFQIIYWDSKALYMEHRFITPKDDFVRAIAICQQRVISCNADDIMKELLGPEGGAQKPEIPLEVAKWIECNEISSANLRNGC